MADFCWTAYRDTLGVAPEENDFAHLCAEDQITSVLCEDHGPEWVDHLGRNATEPGSLVYEKG